MPSAELGPGEMEVSLLSALSHGHRSSHPFVVRALAGEAAATALAESGKLRQKDFFKNPTWEPVMLELRERQQKHSTALRPNPRKRLLLCPDSP